MHLSLQNLLLASVLFIVISPALQGMEDAPPSPREIIRKAIQSSGGNDNLKKLATRHVKARGTYYQGEASAPVTAEFWSQIPNKKRTEVMFTVDDMMVKLARVYNGKQAWNLMSDGNWKEVTDRDLKALRQSAHEDQVLLIYPLLKDGEYELTAIGEDRINGRAALGVRVKKDGYNDISIHFDKDSALLVKSQMRIIAHPGDKDEVLSERFFMDHKRIKGGVTYATKQVLSYDGKKESELELIEMTPLDEIKSSFFEKP